MQPGDTAGELVASAKYGSSSRIDSKSQRGLCKSRMKRVSKGWVCRYPVTFSRGEGPFAKWGKAKENKWWGVQPRDKRRTCFSWDILSRRSLRIIKAKQRVSKTEGYQQQAPARCKRVSCLSILKLVHMCLLLLTVGSVAQVMVPSSHPLITAELPSQPSGVSLILSGKPLVASSGKVSFSWTIYFYWGPSPSTPRLPKSFPGFTKLT